MASKTTDSPERLIVGISGASGAALGIRVLQLLSTTSVETHLVVSKAAALTIQSETDYTIDAIRALADQVHTAKDISASIASGSFRTKGMIIAPCSIKTMSEICSGVTSNLMSRAADVVLKERRKLVLMLRESPLHAGHLKTALEITNMGAIISPPVPAFYTKPESVEDVVTQIATRALDLFDIECTELKRWGVDVDLSS